MPSPPDRPIHILEIDPSEWPLPPLNFFCQSGLEPEIVDLRWSSPSELPSNTKFNILGVNIYRSFDSEFGPYTRINAAPIGSNFYRDKTQIAVAINEDVSDRFITKGDADPSFEWTFRTSKSPIVINGPIGTADCISLYVQVTVNGVQAAIQKIVSSKGEVTLLSSPTFDAASQTQKPAVLPKPGDCVLASYRYLNNSIKTDLDRKIFYRITTVALDEQRNLLVETPINRAAQSDNKNVEQIDWIWREAVRRNRFLLIQGGERVKVFIRKTVGPKCGCYSNSHRQPSADCLVCYGSGIIGGYEGPFDIMVAPDDGAKNIEQSNRGRSFNHSYETWTGPQPSLSQRDFILKLNGDRYTIGPVRSPSNRGMRLQQMFSISHLDEQDIRYKVPANNTVLLAFPETRWQKPGDGNSTSMVTERSAIPDEREFRGNTVVFENEHRR